MERRNRFRGAGLRQDAPGFARTLLQTVSIVISAWIGRDDAHGSWVVTATHAFPLRQTDVVHFASENESISVNVVLQARQPETLTRAVQQMGGFGDPGYKPPQSISRFLPTVGQAKEVADYLLQSGLRNVKIADDRLLVTATGSGSTVRRAFNTVIVDVNRDGIAGIANVSNVQLPEEVAPLVLAVLGLQTLVHAHALSVPSLDP